MLEFLCAHVSMCMCDSYTTCVETFISSQNICRVTIILSNPPKTFNKVIYLMFLFLLQPFIHSRNFCFSFSCMPGCTQAQRWTSGAAVWFCTPCCVALCPLMMSTFPRSLRRSEEGCSTSRSTWTALWPRCWCSCCKWIPWKEPPSKTSGTESGVFFYQLFNIV